MLSFTIKIPTLKDLYLLVDRKARMRTVANNYRVMECRENVINLIETITDKKYLIKEVEEEFDRLRLYNVGYWSKLPKKKEA